MNQALANEIVYLPIEHIQSAREIQTPKNNVFYTQMGIKIVFSKLKLKILLFTTSY